MEESELESKATLIFVLGLLSLLVCQLCGPAAWIMGNTYMREAEALGVQPNGMAVAGRILGIVSSVLMLLSLLMFAFIIVIYVAMFGLGALVFIFALLTGA